MKYTDEMLQFIRGCYHIPFTWDETAKLFARRFQCERVPPHLLLAAMKRHFGAEINQGRKLRLLSPKEDTT